MYLIALDKREVVNKEKEGTKVRFPLLGIAATAVGTVLAVALIPDNPAPPGALFWPALALSIGLMTAPVVAAIRQPKSILRAEHLLVLAPIYWLLLDLLQGVFALDGIESTAISSAFLAIGFFVTAVWLGTKGRSWKIPEAVVRSVSQEFSGNVYFGLGVTAFVLGMLNFAVACNFDIWEMAYYVGESRWAAPWGRGNIGGWDAFLDHLQYFGYLLPTLTVVISGRLGWRNWRTLLCAVMAAIMTLFLAQSGSRRVIGVVIGMAIVQWVLSHQRLRFRQVVTVIVVIAALLIALQFMLEYRNTGMAAFVRGEQADEAFELEENYLRVDDNFYRLCQVIQIIPDAHPYVYHKYVVYILARPIPRVLWPGKPVDSGFDLPNALGVTGVSFSYSVVGELYMSLGFIGILLGGFFCGRLCSMATNLLERHQTLGALIVYSVMAMALFAGMRSLLDLVLVSYVVLAWLGLSKLLIGIRRYPLTRGRTRVSLAHE